MSGKYDDIITLPHPVSAVHPPMSRHDRAAQFSPFAALTGYEDVLRESSRSTAARREADEQQKQEIDRQLRYISEKIREHPEIETKFYVSDRMKDGGSYRKKMGKVKKIDFYSEKLLMQDGTEIDFHDIWELSFKQTAEKENE